MSNKADGLNTPEAKAKREKTVAKRKAIDELEQKYQAIATTMPAEWADTEQAKLSLVKSIHSDILGKDKEGDARPMEDLRYFMFQAAQRNLNPFKKQIHAVYIWDSKKNAEQLIPITGIDGFAAIAQRSPKPKYAGLGETRFTYFPEDHPKWAGKPESASVDIYAYNPITGAREAVFTATVWWDEYVKLVDVYENNRKTGEKKPNSTWETRSRGQLEKCAQALAFRRMYPDELGGLYVIQEVERHQVTPEPETEQEQRPSTRDTVEQALRERKQRKQAQEGEILTGDKDE